METLNIGIAMYAEKISAMKREPYFPVKRKSRSLNINFTRIDRKDATCTEDGNIDYWHCERCGKNYDDTYNGKELESVIYPATGHNLEFIPGVVADCQNEGRYDYYYCNNCGKFFLDQEGKQEVTSQDLVIPEDKNNHNIRCEKGYEATCVREGMKTYYICNNCRKLFLDENGTQEVTEAELIIPRRKSQVNVLPGRAADCGNSARLTTIIAVNVEKISVTKKRKRKSHRIVICLFLQQTTNGQPGSCPDEWVCSGIPGGKELPDRYYQ